MTRDLRASLGEEWGTRWNADHERPNAISRLRYHVMYVEKILERIEKTAPAGADLKSR